MEEQYELISKSKIKEYKDEISRLKNELETLKSAPKPKEEKVEKKEDTKKQIKESFELKEFLVQIQEQSKVEQEKLNKQLNDIKELNKKTLDNVLTQNQEFSVKYEQLVETLKHLTLTLTEIIDEFPSKNSTQITTLLEEIKLSVSQNEKKETQDERINSDPEVLAKLDDIETFMKNLRILLSYVKPNDLKIDKN